MNTLKTILITLLLTSTTVICAQHGNVFLGDLAGANNTTGERNTFLGYATGHFNTTGERNTFLGHATGYQNTTGKYNTFLGYATGYKNTIGSNNTFLGYYSGYQNTTGNYNTFLGYSTGHYNTTGGRNTFLGFGAGYQNTTGSYNAFSGFYAGRFNTTGNNNTFSGYATGHKNTTGKNNTYIGFQAGNTNSVGIGNVFLGYQAGYYEKGSNKLYISNTSSGTPLIYGNFETNRIGIGTTTPSYELEVNGTIRSKEVLVESGPWPDYVFAKDYVLPTLTEVENHIKEKGHLQNIPSAEEVSKNGIQLGKMNTKLLEKIEELTLYIIDQEKRIKALENK